MSNHPALPSVPAITVVIPTRNRGDRVLRTIQSILRSDCTDVEIVVVDQSDGAATETAMDALRHERRILYMRTATRGRAAALNVGIGAARAALIAVTDDDCEVDADWLRALVDGFAVDPQIAVVFGNVIPAPHDPEIGFVPAYVRSQPFLARGIGDRHRVAGTSACVGLLRATWQQLGGFDPMLGTGARFKAGEEADFTMRVLLHGAFIYETPHVSVVHHGFYRWEELPAVLWGYWYGTGAAFAKSLKRHPGPTLTVLARLAQSWAGGTKGMAESMGPTSHRWRRLAAFAAGVGAGMLTRLDKATGHFVPPRSEPRSGEQRPRPGLET